MTWDWAYRGETRTLDDSARAGAGGSFVSIGGGITHYELTGPEDLPPVVLVHGFSVPYFIWDDTFPALASAGCRVLRYDLFGRGYSDRPHARYALRLFVQQLADLLDALRIDAASLVGLSMGGAIAASFTAEYPARVRRLALIDPIGTEPMPLNLLYRTALLPGVSELLLGLFGTDRMVEGLAGDVYDPAEVQRLRNRYREQVQFRGFKRAILSTLRSGAVDGAPGAYERLGRLSMPVLLIWGREDRTLPLAQSEPIRRLVPRAQFHIIEQAGHIPHVERPEAVHPLLLKFLSENDRETP